MNIDFIKNISDGVISIPFVTNEIFTKVFVTLKINSPDTSSTVTIDISTPYNVCYYTPNVFSLNGNPNSTVVFGFSAGLFSLYRVPVSITLTPTGTSGSYEIFVHVE